MSVSALLSPVEDGSFKGLSQTASRSSRVCRPSRCFAWSPSHERSRDAFGEIGGPRWCPTSLQARAAVGACRVATAAVPSRTALYGREPVGEERRRRRRRRCLLAARSEQVAVVGGGTTSATPSPAYASASSRMHPGSTWYMWCAPRVGSNGGCRTALVGNDGRLESRASAWHGVWCWTLVGRRGTLEVRRGTLG